MSPRQFRTRRAVGVVLAVVASVSLGVVLIWRLVTPEVVQDLATSELLALFGLLLLPVLTVCAILADRRAAANPGFLRRGEGDVGGFGRGSGRAVAFPVHAPSAKPPVERHQRRRAYVHGGAGERG